MYGLYLYRYGLFFRWLYVAQSFLCYVLRPAVRRLTRTAAYHSRPSRRQCSRLLRRAALCPRRAAEVGEDIRSHAIEKGAQRDGIRAHDFGGIDFVLGTMGNRVIDAHARAVV